MAGDALSLEISPELHAGAAEKLSAQANVKTVCADAFDWKPEAACDAVVLTGSMPQYDDRFEQWLAGGGRLFCITGRQPIMEALLITRGEQRIEESLFETVAAPLTNAPQPDPFRL
jgi:protein-L-isoaspartate(D-aspartate) O-methyltransferase